MKPYRWNAKDYNQNSANQEKWAKELIARLKLKGSERILDIGSGDGKVTADIARLVPKGRVTGVDISPEMIRFSKQTFGKIPNLNFRQADASALPFNKEFDVVVSFTCLHWVISRVSASPGISMALRSISPGSRRPPFALSEWKLSRMKGFSGGNR